MKLPCPIIVLLLFSGELAGCVHTISGPGRAPRSDAAVDADGLRVIYAGEHHAQPAEFISDLERALSRQINHPVTIEVASERQSPEPMRHWPKGISEPVDGERTVLIRAVNRFRCGTPATMAMMGSAMTLGLLPFIDGDAIVWNTEFYSSSSRLLHESEFKVDWRLYGWLPLIPFVPINMAWRAIRGDEHDYFVRTFPSHLVAELGMPNKSVEPTRWKDARGSR